MKTKNAYRRDYNDKELHEVLDLYFSTCSLLVTTKDIAVCAATLANGGLNPYTGQRIFAMEDVRGCLTLMSSCGLYDGSGENCYHIGVPMKSGVGGGIMAVLPGAVGITTFSPKLNHEGNSVRGVAFMKQLAEVYCIHQHGIAQVKIEPIIGGLFGQVRVSGTHLTQDPDLEAVKRLTVIDFAASGDLSGIKSLDDVFVSDSDGRTALHLAVENEQLLVVKYLTETLKAPEWYITAKDRWGQSALEISAKQQGGTGAAKQIHSMLLSAVEKPQEHLQMARLTEQVSRNKSYSRSFALVVSGDSTGLHQWCVEGALARIIAHNARYTDHRVIPAAHNDSDGRVPLHLACCEGNVEVVRYLVGTVIHAARTSRIDCRAAIGILQMKDIYGRTATDEAKLNGHPALATMIKAGMGMLCQMMISKDCGISDKDFGDITRFIKSKVRVPQLPTSPPEQNADTDAGTGAETDAATGAAPAEALSKQPEDLGIATQSLSLRLSQS